MKKLLSILVLLQLKVCFSQQAITLSTFQIEAQLLNEKTKEPIAYANIYTIDTKIGTASNSEGKFSLTKLSNRDTLIFYYLGYEKLAIPAKALIGVSKVYLKPKASLLNEITILGDNSFLYELVANCKKNQGKQNRTAKTYFELETYREEEQVEYVESYFNGEYSGYDVNKLKLKNGRIYVKPVNNQLFFSTESSRAIYMHKLFENEYYFPYNPLQFNLTKLKKTYQLNLEKKYKDDDLNTVYQIEFSPKQDFDKYFSGTLWVDSSKNELIKIKLSIKNAAKHPFRPLTGLTEIAQLNLTINKTFIRVNNEMSLDKVDFNYSGLSYFKDDSLGTAHYFNTKAFIQAYNYESSFSLPQFSIPELMYIDYVKILSAPYNDFFWDNIDEFKLSDIDNKNQLFRDSNQRIINGKYEKEGKKQQLFEYRYKTWDSTRIAFRELSKDSITSATQVNNNIPLNKYNIAIQLYLDINKLKDSLHFCSATIFDAYQSFYNFPMNALSHSFINIYFDLMEIRRQLLMEKLIKGAKTEMEALAIYKNELKLIEQFSDTYFSEVQRG